MQKQSIAQLNSTSTRLRIRILEMLHNAGSGHPGGSLSAIDILAVLYHNVMRHDPENPCWPERDRFILSKGHICPALYAVLAECGYFDEKELDGLRKFGCSLQGHPCMEKTPGIEVSAGSLGQGLSIATGIALGLRMDGSKSRVYCMMGDGEQQEGQIWEAAMSAGHYRLDSLCGIVDCNGLQIDGRVDEVLSIEPLADKWAAFGWNVIPIDGHDFAQIETSFQEALCFERETERHPRADGQRKRRLFHGKQTRMAWNRPQQGRTRPRVVRAEKGTGGMRTHLVKLDLQNCTKRLTRDGYGEGLLRAAEENPNVVALGADISESVRVSWFKERYPERFISLGISEQNQMGVAAGLSLAGKVPFVTNYGVFLAGRAWDQIRTTVCYANLNVKLGGAHGGISVGPDGGDAPGAGGDIDYAMPAEYAGRCTRGLRRNAKSDTRRGSYARSGLHSVRARESAEYHRRGHTL